MSQPLGRVVLAITMSLLAALSVAGCSAEAPLPFFDQSQQNDDILPFGVTEDRINKDSSRLLGSDSAGVEYFVAKTFSGEPSEGSVCFIVVPLDGQWAIGCGEMLPLTVGIDSGKQATLYSQPNPDDSATGEWVGKYVHVEPQS